MKSVSIRRSFLLAAALLPVNLSILHAADEPEAFVLAKAEYPKPGTIIQYRNVMKMENGSVKMTKGAKSLEGTVSQDELIDRATGYIEPGRMRSVLNKSEHFWTFTFNGKPQKSEDPRSQLIGEPVIIEEKDGKWVSSLETGKQLDEDGQKELEGIDPAAPMQLDLTLYGTTARKPGDKWDVDVTKVASFMDVDKPKGSISVEFVKLAEIDGEKCAELRIVFDLNGGPESGETKIHAKGEYLLHRSVKDLIDRKGKLTEETEVTNEGDQWDTMTIKGTETMEKTFKVSGS